MSEHWNRTKHLPDFPLDATIDICPWRRKEDRFPEARNSGRIFFTKVLMKEHPMTVARAIELAKEIGITEDEVQLHLKWLQTWVENRPPVVA